MPIREKLIKKINTCQDEKFLESMYAILESQETPLALTDAERKAIEQGLRDVRAEKVLAHDHVIRNAQKWLRSKR